MADKKITELPLIFSGDITSNDVLPIVDVDLDITNRIELDQLKSYINSGQTDTYITGGTFDIYSGVTTFTNNFGDSFQVTDFPVSNYKYIPSGVTVTIPTNTQKFIYGNINIDGELVIEVDSELFVLNGTIITTGGTITQFGNIVMVDLPEFDTKVTGFTYSNNTLSILDNSGNVFNTTINTMTGLTINGSFSATTL